MKAIIFAVASLVVVTASATPSVARPYYQGLAASSISSGHRSPALHQASRSGRGHTSRHYTSTHRSRFYSSDQRSRHYSSSRANHYVQRASLRHGSRTAHAGVGPRPSRWCGWWMRTQKGGGPEYNLAANWRHWGRPSGPRVGAVVVWSHHVGMITGRTAGGEWIVKSGNDGGAVRERPRSVAGAVFRV
jgi:hypothetical protein